MKKLSLFLLILSVPLLFAGCNNGENEPQTPKDVYVAEKSDLPTIQITLQENTDDDSLMPVVSVLFTPSANAASFEFAIDAPEKHLDFIDGLMDTESIEGNSAMSHTFDGLLTDMPYMIFARAFDSDGNAGAATTLFVHTTEGLLNVTTSYVSNESMAFKFYGYEQYERMEFALVQSIGETVISDFEEEEFNSSLLPDERTNDMKMQKQNLYGNFTYNYFDLEENTTYYLLLRARDRFDNWTKTYVIEQKTYATSEVPVVTLNEVKKGYWGLSLSMNMNDNAGKYYVDPWEIDMERSFTLDIYNYAGDIMGYLADIAAGGTYVYSEDTVMVMEPNSQGFDFETYFYTLVYDKDNKPFAVSRTVIEGSEYNMDPGTANVTATVEPNESIANITFYPNEYTEGFFFEIYATQWILDNIGGTDPESMKILIDITKLTFSSYVSKVGTYYQYNAGVEDETFWPLTFDAIDTNNEFPSGTEFCLVIIPLNANGAQGIGTAEYYFFNKF